MSSTAITTIVKMVESQPEDLQKRFVEHPREYGVQHDRFPEDLNLDRIN